MRKTQTAALLALLAAPWAAAANYELEPQSRLRLEGDSTLHAYASEATRLEAALEWTGDRAQLTLRVPVEALRSAHKGLDKNLRKALSADKHPDIEFRLSRYSIEESTGPRTVVGTGALTVAGVTRERTVRAALRETATGLTLEGEHALKMTDFGVKPPTALLGTVRAKDEIVVKFTLDLRRKP
ncbi:MAG: YceI family protein [Elusimicrobia bacterium]|nr:YceI family protein [Elusimicrobiota bacterium]